MDTRCFATILLSCAIMATGCDGTDPVTSRPTTPTDPEPDTATPRDARKMAEAEYEVAEVYVELRNQVLQVKPDAIGEERTDDSTVIAVLMETAYSEAIVTLVAVADGTASLYFSNGGGIIGGGGHEPVRKVCAGFIAGAQQYVSQSTSTDTFPLPIEGSVRFYLVTGVGVYTFEALEDDLGYERHTCSPLFHKGHELITAIREHTPE